MSDEVKAVSEVAKDIAVVKELARSVATELRASIAEVTDHLHIAKDVSSALRAAGLELRQVLGTTTNNPPSSEKYNP